MNCKFHPEAKAVTKCAKCGAELCSLCQSNAFYVDEEHKPICLDCSLEAAEKDLEKEKADSKIFFKDGLIACGIWIGGLILGAIVSVATSSMNIEVIISLCSMLGAAIFLFRGVLLIPTTEERGFFKALKSVFWNIVLVTFFLPIWFIFFLIMDKISVSKAYKKVKKIKIALGIAN